MYLKILPLLISSFFLNVYADSAVQGDWSGGPGVWGPVNDWDDRFYFETHIECDSVPGEASLQYDIEYLIAENFWGASSVHSEDIDGDGDMDVLGSAAGDDDITWWENVDGSGTTWEEHTVDGDFDEPWSVYSGDIDGEGDMDILGAAEADGIAWWENEDSIGLSWTKHIIDADFEGVSIYSEDIDDDGDLDVISADYNNDCITWWENVDGLGASWIAHIVDADFDGALSVYSEDIDGDGDMDVLGAAFGDDDITWWQNSDGTGTSWIEHTIDEYYWDARSIYSVDLDNDGDMDVLGTTESGAGDITWWENEDSIGLSWSKHIIDADFEGISIYSEDLDGDGDLDVLSADYDDNCIAWWENVDGLGASWIAHIVDADFDGAYSVYSEDINGDGDMDVLGAALQDDLVLWWDLHEYSLDGILESSCLYLSNDPGWGSISWTTTEPSGTSVAFLVRSCDSPDISGMGAWSDTLHSPCSLYGLLNEGDSYFQYKAILQTSETTLTPVLEDVTVTWNPTGIEESENYSLGLLPFTPNPSSSPQVEFYLPEAGCARFSIFNLSGRLVNEIHGDDYTPGYHVVLLGTLSPGIYFCRMTVGDFTATKRFVVIQ